MKRMLLVAMLCAVTVSLGGCFVSIKGDGCTPGKAIQHPEMDSTIAEIDAVKMLGSESARLNVLRTIAHRPHLSPEARIHLVEATRMLGSESSREEVLMALAENPPVGLPPMPQPKPCGKDADN